MGDALGDALECGWVGGLGGGGGVLELSCSWQLCGRVGCKGGWQLHGCNNLSFDTNIAGTILSPCISVSQVY